VPGSKKGFPEILETGIAEGDISWRKESQKEEYPQKRNHSRRVTLRIRNTE
jgi:hypothetical protein